MPYYEFIILWHNSDSSYFLLCLYSSDNIIIIHNMPFGADSLWV